MVAKTEELFKLLWTCAYLRMTIYFALSGNRADTAGDIFRQTSCPPMMRSEAKPFNPCAAVKCIGLQLLNIK